MIEEPGRFKVRILVVEDNPADIYLLREALQTAELDCELMAIDDGREALACVRQQGKYAGSVAPDLAILDLNLPKNDGLEILEAMRANPAFADVPVAIFSSSSSPRDRAKLQNFRIGRYITKPIDLEEYLRIGLVLRDFLIESRARGASSGG